MSSPLIDERRRPFRSRIRTYLRKVAERLTERFYEGPSPPPRYADEARLYVLLHPTATILELEAYAVSLADVAYREGYVRGYESELRNREIPAIPLERPDVTAARESSFREVESLRSLLDGESETDPLRGVPIEDRAIAIARLGAMTGDWKVVVVCDDKA